MPGQPLLVPYGEDNQKGVYIPASFKQRSIDEMLAAGPPPSLQKMYDFWGGRSSGGQLPQNVNLGTFVPSVGEMQKAQQVQTLQNGTGLINAVQRAVNGVAPAGVQTQTTTTGAPAQTGRTVTVKVQGPHQAKTTQPTSIISTVKNKVSEVVGGVPVESTTDMTANATQPAVETTPVPQAEVTANPINYLTTKPDEYPVYNGAPLMWNNGLARPTTDSQGYFANGNPYRFSNNDFYNNGADPQASSWIGLNDDGGLSNNFSRMAYARLMGYGSPSAMQAERYKMQQQELLNSPNTKALITGYLQQGLPYEEAISLAMAQQADANGFHGVFNGTAMPMYAKQFQGRADANQALASMMGADSKAQTGAFGVKGSWGDQSFTKDGMNVDYNGMHYNVPFARQGAFQTLTGASPYANNPYVNAAMNYLKATQVQGGAKTDPFNSEFMKKMAQIIAKQYGTTEEDAMKALIEQAKLAKLVAQTGKIESETNRNNATTDNIQSKTVGQGIKNNKEAGATSILSGM